MQTSHLTCFLLASRHRRVPACGCALAKTGGSKSFLMQIFQQNYSIFFSVANLVVFLWFCPSQVSASEQSKKEASKAVIKTLFEERYKAGKNKWFFQKLRF